MVLCILPIAFIANWSVAGLGFVGLIALALIARPVITVYQQEIVKPIWQPAMSGATTMAAALSMGLMALIGGYIVIGMGYRLFFLIGAFVTLAGTVLFGATRRYHQR
jgi:predicted MFS family arabinose efflux permease